MKNHPAMWRTGAARVAAVAASACPGGGMGGRRINIPMGGSRGGGFSISTIVLMVIAYFALKFLFGVDLLDMVNGGGGGFQAPGQVDGRADAADGIGCFGSGWHR